MTSDRRQWIVGSVFSTVVIVGLLVADGLFARIWPVSHPLRGASASMSDFGPPTRTRPAATIDGAVVRAAVAEPLYVDVRIPSFFDRAAVTVQVLDEPTRDERLRIGVEMGEGSGDVRFFETTRIATAHRIFGSEGQASFRATVPLDEVAMPGNRVRIVLSMPDASPEQPRTIVGFWVKAYRSSSLLHALLSRLGL